MTAQQDPHVQVQFVQHGGLIFFLASVCIVLQVIQFFALLPRTIKMLEDGE